MYVCIRKAYRAEVAELADARDSKSRAPRGHVGSTPTFGTTLSTGITTIFIVCNSQM